ncbi:serpin family protein [Halobacteriales archaeon QS_1_68_20]|nr:MAG: serpin family protein [Halobacteriales archaeon QS_1_68_20]
MPPTRRRALAVAAALLPGALAGCLADEERQATVTTFEDPERVTATEGGLDRLVEANTAFALDLYRRFADRNEGNLFASPYSVSVALAMAWAGADGETRTEMAETLGFTFDDETVHRAFAELWHELDARSDVDVDRNTGENQAFELNVANALWGHEEFPFSDEYLETLRTYYAGGVHEVDFVDDPGAARDLINAWVADRTGGHIEELLPRGSVNANTRVVLTNAIYFLASWYHPFPADDTEPRRFENLEGTTTTVPTMRQSAEFPYTEVDGHQVVELPYVGQDVAMLVVVPESGAFEGFERSLDTARLTELVEGLRRRDGDVTLPKFEVESTLAASEALQALGMERAFDGRADFGGMVDGENPGLSIDEVYHQSFVSVDERGTEAAAATGVPMPVDGPENPFELVVDRPFLFAIRDRPTGTVLFLGRVVDAGAFG